MAVEEQWVDIDDVSAHLKVNKETVRRWIKIQNFPSYRAGNLLRFKLSEVDAWVRQDDNRDMER
jgi:excisionase family DNA binding protein